MREGLTKKLDYEKGKSRDKVFQPDYDTGHTRADQDNATPATSLGRDLYCVGALWAVPVFIMEQFDGSAAVRTVMTYWIFGGWFFEEKLLEIVQGRSGRRWHLAEARC
jgi:hypothetical protein